MRKKDTLRLTTLIIVASLVCMMILAGCGSKDGSKGVSGAEYNKVGINKVILGEKATKKQLDSLIMDSHFVHQDGPVEFNVDKQEMICGVFLPTSTTVHGVVSGWKKKFHNTLYYRGEKLKTEEEIIDYFKALKDVVPADKYVEDIKDDTEYTITVYEDDYYIEMSIYREYLNVTIERLE